MSIGTPNAYAPIVLPRDALAAVLGRLQPGGEPAMLFEDRGDAQLFWSDPKADE